MNNDDLTRLRHVMWLYGDHRLGLQPGDFVLSLLYTIQRADTDNRILLARGFPEYVGLVETLREPEALEAAIILVKVQVPA